MDKNSKKIGLMGLVLMIFSSIFGYSNSLTAFYQMGYSSIIWYAFVAIFYFLPSALMFAEYGASFKSAKGGIFSWLRGSIGEKPAFIGTFIWLAAWVIWLVSSTQFFLVALSTLIYGKDTTQTWSLFGLSSNATLGILEIVFLVVVCFIATHGFGKIAKITSVAGFFTMGIAIAFIVVSILIWIMQGGHTAQALNGYQLTHSPNHNFQSPISILSFIVYALFAFGGLETMAGVIDHVHKPEKTFPRALITAMIIMTVLYVFAIFACGISADWNKVLGKNNVDLANVEFTLVNNMGIVVGQHLGLSASACATLGRVFSRITALSDVFGGLGAAFVMVYSPIKSFIEGCDPRILPKRLTKLNSHDMPSIAMWCEVAFVSCIILLIGFGGTTASGFYTILMDMMNVSSACPYLFLIGAFPFFKAKKDLERPFVFYKNPKLVWPITIGVWLIVAAGIIFTVVEPILSGDYMTAFWTAFGPVFFGIVAYIYYTIAENKLDLSKPQ
ncbi:glutamate/gamma-aminobutyrate family transporter YjeM [Lactobacillus corticis]|uniref:Amino acid permease n=1 Tax=Lactobacillus corticis TaxID=2201249 RepID=A0A916VI61_9LACO|nr:glutamate/gamma-aminobutyrate family transporter YjeM [Lactobacillus corticis]GFZ26955.1 amino acid permease [Lactobacillus corticis]